MTEFNIFTENIFEEQDIDEKDVIEKTRKLLEFYISDIGSYSCLEGKKYDSI